jgi:hypothetical protein
MIIAFQLLLSMALATPCADGWQSSSSGSGTCSHHGGIAGGSSGYYPTYSPTYSAPKEKLQTWTTKSGINKAQTHTWHSTTIQDDDLYISGGHVFWPMELSYTLYCGESEDGTSKSIGGLLTISVPVGLEAACQSVGTPCSTFTTSAEDGNEIPVSFVSGNRITTIQSWSVSTAPDETFLSKPIGQNYNFNRQGQEPPKSFSVSELHDIGFADYVVVNIGGVSKYLKIPSFWIRMKEVSDACK